MILAFGYGTFNGSVCLFAAIATEIFIVHRTPFPIKRSKPMIICIFDICGLQKCISLCYYPRHGAIYSLIMRFYIEKSSQKNHFKMLDRRGGYEYNID